MVVVWFEGFADGDRIYLSGTGPHDSIQEGQLSHTHGGWTFVSRNGSSVPFPSGHFESAQQALQALLAAGVEVEEYDG
ncbi:MAG: hypothetical protein WEC82_00715 [Xanthobacteraceae bacterium]